LPVSNWTSLGIITNFTGDTEVTNSSPGNHFYQARQSP